MTTVDWRLPENRLEAFLRQYGMHLKYKTHPGLVYSFLPAIAQHYGLDERGRAWLTWLNGNTQNPAMSLLLGEASSWDPIRWQGAVDFWNDNFKAMDWDTDRRHQKSKFGVATAQWIAQFPNPVQAWGNAHALGWTAVWDHAFSQPYMGRLSAWSMLEYARILGLHDRDAISLLLRDRDGSRSHRNGLALLAGAPFEAAHWTWDEITAWTTVSGLEDLGEALLAKAKQRFPNSPDVGYLTLESALCTWKSWHKPNRRYPNVYADMAYNRLMKAEARFGTRFQVLWDARAATLPDYLRLECSPHDPGLVPAKQNLYRETGVPAMLHVLYPEDMSNPLNLDIDLGLTPVRSNPRWT